MASSSPLVFRPVGRKWDGAILPPAPGIHHQYQPGWPGVDSQLAVAAGPASLSRAGGRKVNSTALTAKPFRLSDVNQKFWRRLNYRLQPRPYMRVSENIDFSNLPDHVDVNVDGDARFDVPADAAESASVPVSKPAAMPISAAGPGDFRLG
jgi:hypothetical protein